MLTNDEKKKLKSMLPHGSHKIIAGMAGVSTQAVATYFNRGSKSERVEDAALDFYRNYKKDKEKKLSGIF